MVLAQTQLMSRPLCNGNAYVCVSYKPTEGQKYTSSCDGVYYISPPQASCTLLEKYEYSGMVSCYFQVDCTNGAKVIGGGGSSQRFTTTPPKVPPVYVDKICRYFNSEINEFLEAIARCTCE